jgi:hypothetical protein
MSQLLLEHYKCNIPRMIIFLKTYSEEMLDAHIRTTEVLTRDKLTRFYFSYLLYAIYYSITAYLRLGKKLSFLPLDDVNPRPVPSRWGLLEDSPYRAIGVVYLSCDWPRPHT